MPRPQKITFGEMRESGVRGVLVYCSDYKCSHYVNASADPWPDHIRPSDLEPKFLYSACGKRGADIRPDFHWDKPGALVTILTEQDRPLVVRFFDPRTTATYPNRGVKSSPSKIGGFGVLPRRGRLDSHLPRLR
jgi:hypothetical protein